MATSGGRERRREEGGRRKTRKVTIKEEGGRDGQGEQLMIQITSWKREGRGREDGKRRGKGVDSCN